MGGTIVFQIKISECVNGFASASNFITKMENGDVLSGEELKGITSLWVRKSENLTLKQSATVVQKEGAAFKPISKPEYLNGVLTRYKIAYCFVVDEKDFTDVVELRYYYLLQDYFTEVSICALLYGSYNFYYKISHYFLALSLGKEKFYNSVFFIKETEEISRLQKKNVYNLMNFVPLQSIDNESVHRLFDKTENSVLLTDLMNSLSDENQELQGDYLPELTGCLRRLSRSGHVFKKLDMEMITKRLLKSSLLSFIFFSYSFYDCMKEKNCNTELVLDFIRQLVECALCCQQLMENIVLHATAKSGVISIRFHGKKTEYLTGHYSKEIKSVPHLEILITDYAGKNTAGNIAVNFRNKVRQKNVKNKFEKLQPIDFLLRDEKEDSRVKEIQQAFTEYYSYSENIGRHYGLKIFNRIISKNNGNFAFYSHTGHVLSSGDGWNLKEADRNTGYVPCIPGTGYSLLFPLEKREKLISRAEVGIDENIQLEDNINLYLNKYNCMEKKFPIIESEYNTQEEKESLIKSLSRELTEEISKKDVTIPVVYISAQHKKPETAELLCKALLIAGYQRNIADYVFYNCSPEFVNFFQQCMSTYFSLGTLSYSYEEKEFSIVLFTEPPIEECIIIPGNMKKTILANKSCGFAGGGLSLINWLPEEDDVLPNPVEHGYYVPPYDILYEVTIENEKKTIFEHYTLQVLEADIQELVFGCKIFNTHMRLGSTIHINSFYEAEILFSNRLFISRFAYLLIKKLENNDEFKKAGRITLYSYALYSEMLVFEIMSILGQVHKDKEIDYAILEREAEHREFSHIDRIRYSTVFTSKEEQYQHFKNRKVICIVPINSTLKTHEKLIGLFCDANKGFSLKNIITNYAIILVGSIESNEYWTIDEANRTFDNVKLEISPTPNYFIAVKVGYHEALGCKMCFPKNPLEEIPLIEVNAASTIPNQSFGLHRDCEDKEKITYDWIREEEKKIAVLKNCLIYSHVQRGENHFMFYFKTDRFFLEQKEKIKNWLSGISYNLHINEREYHILVCPSHFSNAGFLEYVNKIIFHEAALIIRGDIDKEYRCNMCAKYSSFQEFLKLLSKKRGEKQVVRTYFIDDSIITGRTYYRTKSLISSVAGIYTNQYQGLDIRIFDKIFVLLDRNSAQSRMAYVEGNDVGSKRLKHIEGHFFAFRTLCISSLRNHGDSCIVCQLEKEARILHHSSATRRMAEYWRTKEENFGVKNLVDKESEVKLLAHMNICGENKNYSRYDEQPYRRMVCTHIASVALGDDRHGNYREKALGCILDLLINDYNGRLAVCGGGCTEEYAGEDAFEYFLSYLKTISRPFLVFDKAVKEAVFDILLVFSELLLNNSSTKAILGTITNKPYIREAWYQFSRIRSKIINKSLSNEQKKDLLLLLMKQLTELKSNYFLRHENIQKLGEFISEFDDELRMHIYEQYIRLVKKLIGVNSDTSKSAWLNDELCSFYETSNLPKSVYTSLVLENARGFFDGIEKLCRTAAFDGEIHEYLCKNRNKYMEYIQFLNFRKKMLKNGKTSKQEILKFLENTNFCIDKFETGQIDDWLKKENVKVIFEKIFNELGQFQQEKKQISRLSSEIKKEISKPQYRDFEKILKTDQWLEYEGLKESIAISIGSSIELLRLAKSLIDVTDDKSDSINIRQRCFTLACLISNVLQSKGVKIMLELPLECDIWEDKLKEQFNCMVRDSTGDQEVQTKYLYDKSYKKEYLVFADSNNEVCGVERLSLEMAKRLNDYSQSEEKQEGYYINDEKNYFVWEIGHKFTHTIIVYIEFYDFRYPKDLNLIRNLMAMNHYFNEFIFNQKTINHLYELLLAEKERLVYNIRKAHSHTEEDVRRQQYEEARQNDDTKSSYYRSYVLTLLADLQVSEVYRQSLKKEYYNRDLEVKFFDWKKTAVILKGKCSFFLVNSSDSSYTKLTVITDESLFCDECILQESDRLMGYSIVDGGTEPFLMIFALIQNAAVSGRGKVTICHSQEDLRNISVYLTKTNQGNLRITNECGSERIRIPEINQQLELPPRKNQGISLWSMSRYTKGLISILLSQKLKMAKEELRELNPQLAEDKLKEIKELLDYMLSKDFQIIVNIFTRDGKNYFCIDIPILFERYLKFEDVFKQKVRMP